jgi:hypothetical protein
MELLGKFDPTFPAPLNRFAVAAEAIHSQAHAQMPLQPRGNGMRFVIQAEDGDVISVNNNVLGIEQELVHVQLDNPLYQEGEIDGFSLSVDQARKLARALLAASRLIENVEEIDLEMRRLEGAVGWNPLGGPQRASRRVTLS